MDKGIDEKNRAIKWKQLYVRLNIKEYSFLLSGIIIDMSLLKVYWIVDGNLWLEEEAYKNWHKHNFLFSNIRDD